jgi:Asp-tRNA(Asn)/Glu-tRNA(Gln) amidotransferase A subunit family amidase
MYNAPSITDVAAKLRDGRVTPIELLEDCLARIRRFDQRVRAWVMVDEASARATAAQLGEELRTGQWRGPLHGIPIGVKDIIDVAGWPTLAGSPLRRGHRAERDATVVARLREAGAILLGKTETTQFASFDPPPTRNPWNLDRTPAGSSSGSAAAVAMGMCLAAMGSQTGGSITRPATYCGVAGCKPTFGRVSLTGIVPLAYHMDHPGPIARTVGDLAAVLEVIAGHDPLDPVSLDLPQEDYGVAVENPAPPRIGLLQAYFLDAASPEVRQAALAAVERLRAAGAEVVSVSLPASFEGVHRSHRLVMAVDAAEYHRANFSVRRSDYGPRISQLLDEGVAAKAVDYSAALARQIRFRYDMQNTVHGFDALLTPATTSTAQGLETTGDPSFNSPFSFTGQPTVSIPCAVSDEGLPIGLQFIGPQLGESQLLSAAAWCEPRIAFDARPALCAEG